MQEKYLIIYVEVEKVFDKTPYQFMWKKKSQ